MGAKFLANLRAGAIGAGRIMSAAGTDIQATLINCFVQPVVTASRAWTMGLPRHYEALRGPLKPCAVVAGWAMTFRASAHAARLV